MNPNENPYNFIFDTNKQKSTLPFLQPQSNTKKIVLLIGFLSGVGVCIMLGVFFIGSFGKANNDDLIRIQGQQTELLRVVALGLDTAQDPELRNRLTTIQTTIASDYYQVADILTKRKTSATKLQLAAYENSETDEALEAAKVDGSFDEVLEKSVIDIQKTYFQELQSALVEATTEIEEGVLETAINNTEIINK